MFEFLRVQDPRSLPPWVILQLQVLSLPDVLLDSLLILQAPTPAQHILQKHDAE
jgi:hypothetical protein